MIKKTILVLVCLFAPLVAHAQVNVTGNLKDIGATNATGSNTFARFSLINYGATIPRVLASNVIINPVKDFHPDANGNISGTIQGNDTITPIATTYQVCIFYQGNQFRCATYSITGNSFNLNTAIPLSSPPPSSQLIYGSKSYVFIQVSPAITWVIPHNFGDKNVQVQCRDQNDYVIVPNRIQLTSLTTTTVSFFTAQAGTCIALTAGNTVFTTLIGDAVVKNPNTSQTINSQDFNLQGALNALGNLTATAGKNTVNAYLTNGDCYIDGVQYARTDVGINAALAACSPGKTHVTAGNYTLTGSITLTCGQSLVFEGNPTLNLSLTGLAPAIAYNVVQCGNTENSVSGSALFNMQNTGGTVFKVCVGGYAGGTFGPADGALNILNQTGNTIDFGPCGIMNSVANFTVQNITSMSTVPGDLIQVITNNYSGTQSAAPYIEAVTFRNIAAPVNVAGRVIRINANATGPEVNVNGLLFTGIFTTNTASGAALTPIHIQSSFTSANSISFRVTDSVIAFPFATGAVTIVDSDATLNTDSSILSVVLDGLDAQGGTVPTIPFSADILANAPSTSDLSYRGVTNATFYRQVYARALTVGSTGSTLNSVFLNQLALNSAFTAIATATCQEQTLTVTGAATTGVALVSPTSDLGNTGFNWQARVSAPNTVSVRACNQTAGSLTPASVPWNVSVIQ